MDGGAKHPLIMDNRLETMGKLMRKGVGLVCLHYAVEGKVYECDDDSTHLRSPRPRLAPAPRRLLTI